MNIKTDAEINIALAKMMGIVESEAKFVYYGHIPDYCNDETAAREVQAAAIAKDTPMYVCALGEAIHTIPRAWTASIEVVAMLLSATPRQRAEAAYMVLRQNEPDTASAPLS